MSKTALRKFVKECSRDELAELLLDLYSSRREIKQYLDFFLNPNVEKLTEEYKAVIEKELGRKKGPRAGKLKQALKDYASYSPGEDNLTDMKAYVFDEACAYHYRKVPQQIRPLMLTLVKEIVAETDRQGRPGAYLEMIRDWISHMPNKYSDWWASYENEFKTDLTETLENAINDLHLH